MLGFARTQGCLGLNMTGTTVRIMPFISYGLPYVLMIIKIGPRATLDTDS